MLSPCKPCRFSWCVLLLAAGIGESLADTYQIDERHTFPAFEISHLGFSVQRGRFNKTSGTVMLDSEKKSGSVAVNIDANSIDTGLSELEEKLKSDDFFNVKTFPVITYHSDSVEFSGEQPVRVMGALTLLGVTRPLNLSIEHYLCGFHPIYMKTVCGINATGTLKRSDFGMTAFSPLIGDEVKIVVQAEGFRQ